MANKKIHPNQELLQRVRSSKVKGPFRLARKDSSFFTELGLDFLVLWEAPFEFGEKLNLESSEGVANYLETYYLARKEQGALGNEYGNHPYSWEVVNERKTLFGNTVLKIRSVPHPDSEAERRPGAYPEHYNWVRISPSF